MATIVYIDGFNLYYGALKGTPHKWLVLAALSRRLLPKDQIVAIRYFTALVAARQGDPQQPQRQQAYLRALRTIPGFTVHLGHYLTHSVRMPLANPLPMGPRTVEVVRTEEKGSDVNLATYLLLDAFQGRCDTAVVISNDSDLQEPIRVAEQQLGVRVGTSTRIRLRAAPARCGHRSSNSCAPRSWPAASCPPCSRTIGARSASRRPGRES
jgi:uncharacterized LabA/DUF88 family protein